MAIILDGKKVSQNILKNLKLEVENILEKTNKKPSLAVILVGNDYPSHVYVFNKLKKAKEIGIKPYLFVANATIDPKGILKQAKKFSLKDIFENNFLKEDIVFIKENLKEKDLLNLIEFLNKHENISGILVQLPLPEGFDTQKVINAINPDKDVDGFHPINMGKTLIGLKDALFPCTPKGVIRLLKEYNIKIQGQNVCMVGAGLIVGKPLSAMFLNENATITTCHIYTKNLKEHTLKADILCSATGVPHLIKEDMVKEGAVVVDIGISRLNGKIVGDVDFENVKRKASFITPVPGGVGPMTIAMLMENTILAFKKALNLN